MQKLLKIFWLGGENHNQKTSKFGGFFPENHCRAPPRGGVIYSSFGTQKRCRISKKSPIFCSECINFCRFFDCEVKITARKPANLMDFFMKIISFGEEWQSVKWKAKKLTRFSQNLKNFFKIHKFLKFFFVLAELPMVSLGQDPLGGANHSQKTSKSCGFFPANHLL